MEEDQETTEVPEQVNGDPELVPQGDKVPFELEDMMADYESQIAVKSRECMMLRMQMKHMQKELAAIKSVLEQLPVSDLPKATPPQRKATAKKRNTRK